MITGNRLEGDARARPRKRKSEDFMKRAADIFLHEAPTRVEELWAAGRSKDYRLVAIAAHTLRCLAGNVDAAALWDLSLEAERAAEAAAAAAAKGANDGKLPDILFEMEIAYAETCAGLRRPPEKASP
jgi:HPt (histidine-containing phosphotransfer) domain-containing protein